MEINGKVAIVTGASAGIGLATARLLAERGAKVALAARSAETLSEIAGELEGSLAVPTDMRDIGAIRSMVERVMEHYGRIDILINNAGQSMYMTIENMDLDIYRSIFELNVVSVVAAMQQVIPIMREQGDGVIVNISSGLSKRIMMNVGPYASTKYALNALTLTARAELERDNIRVSLMIPGLTETGFQQNAAATRIEFPRQTTMMMDTPEHVAEKIVEAIESEAAEVYADSIRPRD